MLWEEKEPNKPYRVPDEIVDLAFKIKARQLPLEHAYSLSKAIENALPWFKDEPRAGVHLIHGAESGNGWMRPEDPENEVLYVSRRTRFSLRLPQERVGQARALEGQKLDIDGCTLEIGEPVVKKLSPSTIIFSRYVISEEQEEEARFVSRLVAELKQKEIPVRKLLCGKTHVFTTPGEKIYSRSVMIADLEVEQSVLIQQDGIGPGRKMGCGLFLPHKGIAAVVESNND